MTKGSPELRAFSRSQYCKWIKLNGSESSSAGSRPARFDFGRVAARLADMVVPSLALRQCHPARREALLHPHVCSKCMYVCTFDALQQGPVPRDIMCWRAGCACRTAALAPPLPFLRECMAGQTLISKSWISVSRRGNCRLETQFAAELADVLLQAYGTWDLRYRARKGNRHARGYRVDFLPKLTSSSAKQANALTDHWPFSDRVLDVSDSLQE